MPQEHINEEYLLSEHNRPMPLIEALRAEIEELEARVGRMQLVLDDKEAQLEKVFEARERALVRQEGRPNVDDGMMDALWAAYQRLMVDLYEVVGS